MTPLIAESWIWWSFVIMVAGCRFASRRMVLGGIRNYQWDDYLMLVTLGFYTTFIAVINIVSHTASNLLPPGTDVSAMSASERHERMFGSKLILVVEECQCCTIWGAKACLIIMYMRLTTFRKENIAIKFIAAYVAITFVVMEVLYLGVWCRPFHEYWAVPTNSIQCSAATDHLITNAVFNLSSDVAMLLIGLPMFLRLKLPWRKKFPVVLVFSLGIFVILAAVWNKVYSFTDPFGGDWVFWYVRESSTALLVANLVFIWGIVKKFLRINSQNGSRADTMDIFINPENTMHSEDKLRIDSMLNSESPLSKKGPEGDLEMAGALQPQRSRTQRQSLTFEQMLAETFTPYVEDGEVNPYTHPMLYFARNPSRLGAIPEPPMEKAVTRNSEETVTVRRTSDEARTAREARQETPVPSMGPSLNSRKSEGSFV